MQTFITAPIQNLYCRARLRANITKTCPFNVHPFEPHFYIAKLGYAGVHLFFLFLLQNIDFTRKNRLAEAVLTSTSARRF